jgi:hypothetical protein
MYLLTRTTHVLVDTCEVLCVPRCTIYVYRVLETLYFRAVCGTSTSIQYITTVLVSLLVVTSLGGMAMHMYRAYGSGLMAR